MSPIPRFRLYGTLASPFVTRVRMQAALKHLEIELVVPPAGAATPGTPLWPLGRIPVLEIDGRHVPESAVIMELVEELVPMPRLHGRTPADRAQVRLVMRATDTYLVPVLQSLRAIASAGGGGGASAAALRDSLAQLDALLACGEVFQTGEITLAECTLVPMLYYLDRLAGAVLPTFTRAEFGRVSDCEARVACDVAAASVLASMIDDARRAAARATAGRIE